MKRLALLLVVPVNNSVHVVKIKRVSDDNRQDEGAPPMQGYLKGLYWLLRGRGTDLRYHAHPLWGRSHCGCAAGPATHHRGAAWWLSTSPRRRSAGACRPGATAKSTAYKLREVGKQHLVIAPGDHIGLGSEQGDYVIAYTLP